MNTNFHESIWMMDSLFVPFVIPFVKIRVHSWLKFFFLRVVEIHERNHKFGCD